MAKRRFEPADGLIRSDELDSFSKLEEFLPKKTVACLLSGISTAHLGSTCHEVQTCCAAETTPSLNLTEFLIEGDVCSPPCVCVFLTRTCPVAVVFCAFCCRAAVIHAPAAPWVVVAELQHLKSSSQWRLPKEVKPSAIFPSQLAVCVCTSYRLCSCQKEMIRTALEQLHVSVNKPAVLPRTQIYRFSVWTQRRAEFSDA